MATPSVRYSRYVRYRLGASFRALESAMRKLPDGEAQAKRRITHRAAREARCPCACSLPFRPLHHVVSVSSVTNVTSVTGAAVPHAQPEALSLRRRGQGAEPRQLY